jgi:hypothetical protein
MRPLYERHRLTAATVAGGVALTGVALDHALRQTIGAVRTALRRVEHCVAGRGQAGQGAAWQGKARQGFYRKGHHGTQVHSRDDQRRNAAHDAQ